MSRSNHFGGGKFRRSRSHLTRVQNAELGYQQRPTRRRREQTAQQSANSEVGLPLFAELFTPDTLKRTFDRLMQDKGAAPGNDEITWRDLSESEAWQLCRNLSRDILTGTYRPSSARTVDISNQMEEPVVLRSLLTRTGEIG